MNALIVDESASKNSAKDSSVSDLTAIRRTLFGIWVIGLCALVWFGILSVQLSTIHRDLSRPVSVELSK